jgi:heme/copper-type cytochrome/quinol oxidase subunit 1
MILPPMGAISEVIAAFSRKSILRLLVRRVPRVSAIAIFGFWCGRTICSSPVISVYSALVFSFLTYAVRESRRP